MSLHHAEETLRDLVNTGRKMGRAAESRVSVRLIDLAQVMDYYADMDARLRSAHVRAHPEAYPTRHGMMRRAASDPGLFAGPKGDRNTGEWIVDAILAVEIGAQPARHRQLCEALENHARVADLRGHRRSADDIRDAIAELTAPTINRKETK